MWCPVEEGSKWTRYDYISQGPKRLHILSIMKCVKAPACPFCHEVNPWVTSMQFPRRKQERMSENHRHRPFIRNAINNIFYRFIFETEKFNITNINWIKSSLVNQCLQEPREHLETDLCTHLGGGISSNVVLFNYGNKLPLASVLSNGSLKSFNNNYEPLPFFRDVLNSIREIFLIKIEPTFSCFLISPTPAKMRERRKLNTKTCWNLWISSFQGVTGSMKQQWRRLLRWFFPICSGL